VGVTREDRVGPRRGRRAIRGALAAACALVGVHAAPARATVIDTGLLYYGELSRVTAVEAVGSLRQEFANGRTGTLRLVYDALTGASPNGATPARAAQTFTSPSGMSGYRVAPGTTPLDGTFRDNRVELSADGTLPLDRLTTVGLGVRFSGESDYHSLGLNGSLSRDLNDRNTTLSAALSFDHDTVSPQGGVPVPFSAMPAPAPSSGEGEGEGGGGPGVGKDVVGAVLSATQVLDRSTLLAASWSVSRLSGYQSDPYKLMSVVDPVNGEPVRYLYESRPESRLRHAVYGQLKRDLGRFTLDLDYRWTGDDWGVRSHAVDLHTRWDLNDRQFVQPHVRWYRQTAADFHRLFLVNGAGLPDHATADARLDAFTAWTFGLKHGRTLANGHLLTVRGEYYHQIGERHPVAAFGDLRDFSLFPALDAVIVQVGYSFGT